MHNPIPESILKINLDTQPAEAVKRSTTKEVLSQHARNANRRLGNPTLEAAKIAHLQDYHSTEDYPVTVLQTAGSQQDMAHPQESETLRLAQDFHIFLWGQHMRGIAKSVAARLPVMSLADGLSNEPCHCFGSGTLQGYKRLNSMHAG